MSSSYRIAAVALTTLLAACQRESAHRPPSTGPSAVTAPADGRVEVRVDDQGYHPATIRAAAGRTLTLVFRRADALNCGEKVKFPSMGNLERDLPVGQAVEVAVTVPASGELAFTCGMGMYRGSVVAQ
jgi:plastocyanin domain-containing protein